MNAETLTRAVVYFTIFACIAYDFMCLAFRWPTISHVVREIDDEAAGLIRWAWIALWLHWWGPLWSQLR